MHPQHFSREYIRIRPWFSKRASHLCSAGGRRAHAICSWPPNWSFRFTRVQSEFIGFIFKLDHSFQLKQFAHHCSIYKTYGISSRNLPKYWSQNGRKRHLLLTEIQRRRWFWIQVRFTVVSDRGKTDLIQNVWSMSEWTRFCDNF